jgi:hypothetical protein
MVYVFYEKLPLYDLSSHTHKFIKQNGLGRKGNCYKDGKKDEAPVSKYDPPLPTSVVKDNGTAELYGAERISYCDENGVVIKNQSGQKYDPPLPTSILAEPEPEPEPEMMEIELSDTLYGDVKINQPANEDGTRDNYRGAFYDPPLPTTMLEIKSTKKGNHSTEKPVALMEWILKYFSKAGDIVLDPTMGSGSTGVACKNMNRDFIGIEMDKEIFEIAKKRLN